MDETPDPTLTSPGPTLGVVGGGQLGRMLGEAAGPLGVEVVVSDPTPDCPARSVVRDQVVGDFDDEATIREVAERADVLTYEIELADPDAMERVADETGTPVHPDPDTLRTIQDKLVQNRAFADAGIPLPEFRRVDDAEDLRAAGEELGWPVMLKARTGGYDGRGNFPVSGPDEAEDALDELGGPALAERFVEFERELAVIGVRGAEDRRTFPVTETVHREEILRETASPARTDEATRERAAEVARDVLAEMDGRGVYGIELFEVSEARSASDSRAAEPRDSDGEILVNEVAPRPHNSGHWTIEGCRTSQFDAHVRAVLGWPLGSTERRSPTVSANLLGDVPEPEPAALRNVHRALAEPDLSLHWYGKREARPLRKMGHVTATGGDGTDTSELLERTRAVRDDMTFRSDGQ
ncbi:5-(carboxyamino)imidazole ribonucleotide synthase [Salinirubellus sp. GCM10025818]|uniref:5-(carboxyamino)imidazole ribonucleotide synthase n=1 Tax=Salinirubellus TaxID=2162630 RepID=UPI0030D3861C